MKDNDRATIIGLRSYGKGLVQQQLGFPDGSMIRLTVARYYTPSGRCIQKPYTNADEYSHDVLKRYESGEFFSQDSIKHTGPQYHTDDNRLKLNNFTEMQEMADYLKTQSLVDKFATYADSHGLKRRNLMIRKSYSLLDRFINSRIIYTMLDEQSWYQNINKDYPEICT